MQATRLSAKCACRSELARVGLVSGALLLLPSVGSNCTRVLNKCFSIAAIMVFTVLHHQFSFDNGLVQ